VRGYHAKYVTATFPAGNTRRTHVQVVLLIPIGIGFELPNVSSFAAEYCPLILRFLRFALGEWFVSSKVILIGYSPECCIVHFSKHGCYKHVSSCVLRLFTIPVHATCHVCFHQFVLLVLLLK